jgi:micrococcal nuclease
VLIDILNYLSVKLTANNYFPFLVAVFILLVSAAFQNNQIIQGKVIGIHDGDSITLLLDNNVQLKVRLEGIDCPEKKQDFGTKAKQFTSDLAFSKTVTVHKTGEDRFGRTLGYVILPDNTNLNEALLKAGLAWHFIKYNDSPGLSQLEAEARSQRVGLWQMHNPIAPWDFRKIKNQPLNKK